MHAHVHEFIGDKTRYPQAISCRSGQQIVGLDVKILFAITPFRSAGRLHLRQFTCPSLAPQPGRSGNYMTALRYRSETWRRGTSHTAVQIPIDCSTERTGTDVSAQGSIDSNGFSRARAIPWHRAGDPPGRD